MAWRASARPSTLTTSPPPPPPTSPPAVRLLLPTPPTVKIKARLTATTAAMSSPPQMNRRTLPVAVAVAGAMDEDEEEDESAAGAMGEEEEGGRGLALLGCCVCVGKDRARGMRPREQRGTCNPQDKAMDWPRPKLRTRAGAPNSALRPELRCGDGSTQLVHLSEFVPPLSFLRSLFFCPHRTSAGAFLSPLLPLWRGACGGGGPMSAPRLFLMGRQPPCFTMGRLLHLPIPLPNQGPRRGGSDGVCTSRLGGRPWGGHGHGHRLTFVH